MKNKKEEKTYNMTDGHKKDLWLVLDYHVAQLKQIRDLEDATLMMIDCLKEKLELEID